MQEGQEQDRTWQPVRSEEEQHQHAGSQFPAAAHQCYLLVLAPCATTNLRTMKRPGLLVNRGFCTSEARLWRHCDESLYLLCIYYYCILTIFTNQAYVALTEASELPQEPLLNIGFIIFQGFFRVCRVETHRVYNPY